MNISKSKIENACASVGWGVTFHDYEGDKVVEFSNYTPFGQDITFELNYNLLKDIPRLVKVHYENFDPSQETYYWIGEDGHGKNGAPDTMGEVYDDMVKAEDMIGDLSNALDRAFKLAI